MHCVVYGICRGLYRVALFKSSVKVSLLCRNPFWHHFALRFSQIVEKTWFLKLYMCVSALYEISAFLYTTQVHTQHQRINGHNGVLAQCLRAILLHQNGQRSYLASWCPSYEFKVGPYYWICPWILKFVGLNNYIAHWYKDIMKKNRE